MVCDPTVRVQAPASNPELAFSRALTRLMELLALTEKWIALPPTLDVARRGKTVPLFVQAADEETLRELARLISICIRKGGHVVPSQASAPTSGCFRRRRVWEVWALRL